MNGTRTARATSIHLLVALLALAGVACAGSAPAPTTPTGSTSTDGNAPGDPTSPTESPMDDMGWMLEGSEWGLAPLDFDEPSVPAMEAIYGYYESAEDIEEMDLLGEVRGAPGVYLATLTISRATWEDAQDGVVPPPFPYEFGSLVALRIDAGEVREIRDINNITGDAVLDGLMGDLDGDGRPELVLTHPGHDHDFEGDDGDWSTYETTTWTSVTIVDAELRTQAGWRTDYSEDGVYRETRAALRDLDADGHADICIEERATVEGCEATGGDGGASCRAEAARFPLMYRSARDAWLGLGTSDAAPEGCR